MERKLNAEEDLHKNHGLKIICSGNIDANMSRDKYVVYDTPININMHTAKKRKELLKLCILAKCNERNRYLALNFNISRIFSHK